MKQITITEFKNMSSAAIAKEGAFELTKDGDVFCVVIVPTTAYIKNVLEEMLVLNAV